MERLASQGETFDLVAGASSGSICGAIVTAGLAKDGPEMWRSFMSTPVVSARYLLSERSPFGMSRILRDGLRRFVPTERLKASRTELLVATTHARSFFREALSPLLQRAGTLRERFEPLSRRMPRSLVVHSSRDRHDDMHDIIAASCFIPVVYPRLVHIDGALHIHGGTLQERVGEVPQDKPVAVVCGSGYRASIASSFLQRDGFQTVSNVIGGMSAWKSAKYPTV